MSSEWAFCENEGKHFVFGLLCMYFDQANWSIVSWVLLSLLAWQQENKQHSFRRQLKPLVQAPSYTDMQETFIQTEHRSRNPNTSTLIQLYEKQSRLFYTACLLKSPLFCYRSNSIPNCQKNIAQDGWGDNTLSIKQCQLQQVAHSYIQMGSEYL